MPAFPEASFFCVCLCLGLSIQWTTTHLCFVVLFFCLDSLEKVCSAVPIICMIAHERDEREREREREREGSKFPRQERMERVRVRKNKKLWTISSWPAGVDVPIKSRFLSPGPRKNSETREMTETNKARQHCRRALSDSCSDHSLSHTEPNCGDVRTKNERRKRKKWKKWVGRERGGEKKQIQVPNECLFTNRFTFIFCLFYNVCLGWFGLFVFLLMTFNVNLNSAVFAFTIALYEFQTLSLSLSPLLSLSS